MSNHFGARRRLFDKNTRKTDKPTRKNVSSSCPLTLMTSTKIKEKTELDFFLLTLSGPASGPTASHLAQENGQQQLKKGILNVCHVISSRVQIVDNLWHLVLS